MEPGLSELGTWNAVGATWDTGATAGVAAAEVGTGAMAAAAVLSGVASNAGAALAGAGAVASVGAAMEEGRFAVGLNVAKGGVGAGTAVASAAGLSTTKGLPLCPAGPAAGCFSGGGVGSEGCGENFGSSEESEEAARRLPKDVGEAESMELDWGTEKACLGFGSGGLNKLPDAAAPMDKSATVESSADFW